MTMAIKALIIDDEPLARQLVARYLEDHPSIEIAGECGDGFEALKTIQQVQPELVFLDIQNAKTGRI
jgi:two-component system LytT family response regulator